MSTPTVEQPSAETPAAQGPVPLPEAQPASEPKVCNFPVPQGTEKDGTVKPTKPCLKALGHTGDHNARKYTKVDTSTIDMANLAVFDDEEELPTIERVTESGGPKTDQERLAVEHLTKSHEAWQRIGKPKNFKDGRAAYGKYRVEPDNEAAVRSMLKRMASHLGINVRIAPRVKLANGEYRLVWMAVDKAARAASSTPAANPTEGGAAPSATGSSPVQESSAQPVPASWPSPAAKPTAPKPTAPGGRK